MNKWRWWILAILLFGGAGILFFRNGLIPGTPSWQAALEVYDWCEASAANMDSVPPGCDAGKLDSRVKQMNYRQARYALMVLHGYHTENLTRFVGTIGTPPRAGDVFREETSRKLVDRMVDTDSGWMVQDLPRNPKTMFVAGEMVEALGRRDPDRTWEKIVEAIGNHAAKRGWADAERVHFGGLVHGLIKGIASEDVMRAKDRAIELARMGEPWSDDLRDDAVSGLLAACDGAVKMADLGNWIFSHQPEFKGLICPNQFQLVFPFPFPFPDEFELGLIYQMAKADPEVASLWCGRNEGKLPRDWPFYLVAGWRQHYPTKVMEELRALAPKREEGSGRVNMDEFQAWMLRHDQWIQTREVKSRAWAEDTLKRLGMDERIKYLDQIE